MLFNTLKTLSHKIKLWMFNPGDYTRRMAISKSYRLRNVSVIISTKMEKLRTLAL